MVEVKSRMWATVVGVILGVSLTYIGRFVDDIIARGRLLRNLRADLKRCININLNMGTTGEMMNGLVFPHIQSAVITGGITVLQDRTANYILNIYYLIDNFHICRSVAIGLIVEEAKANISGVSGEEAANARMQLQNKAIGSLEMSLRSYAELAVNALDAEPKGYRYLIGRKHN
jgi:uncharacterized membrane protein